MKKTISKNLPLIAVALFILIILSPGIAKAAESCASIVGPGFSVMTLIKCYVDKIFSFVLYASGTLSAIMILISGFLYITSTGNPEKVATANKALTGAIIGLVIVVLSYGIILYVQEKLTSGATPPSAEEYLSQTITTPGINGGSITTPGTGGSGEITTPGSTEGGITTPGLPLDQIIINPDGTFSSTSPVVVPSVSRVRCLYMGMGELRGTVYVCYENWSNANAKLNALDAILESRGKMNNPCDIIASEYSASQALNESPSTYCNDQGTGSNCASAEAIGDAVFNNTCF